MSAFIVKFLSSSRLCWCDPRVHVPVCSERWAAPLRDRWAFLSSRCGVQLLWWCAERACPVGDLLRSDCCLRPGTHRAAAATGGAVPTQEQLWGDNGRVFAGPSPYKVTEKREGEWEGEWRMGAASRGGAIPGFA